MRDDRSSALGCGCAVIPGLLLGLVFYALVGLIAGKPAAAPSVPAIAGPGEVRVALSEPYLSRVLSEMIDPSAESEWQVNVLPNQQVHLQGQVMVSAFGKEIAIPLGLLLRLDMVGGNLRLTLVEAEVPGELDAAKITSLVNPMLDLASQQFQLELAHLVGSGWRLIGVNTTETEVNLLLAPGAEQ